MDEIESCIQQLITKIYIIFNAIKLGWIVEISDGQIVLSKELNKLTNLDKNTRELVNALICDNVNIMMDARLIE